jgi:hypothetical protein
MTMDSGSSHNAKSTLIGPDTIQENSEALTAVYVGSALLRPKNPTRASTVATKEMAGRPTPMMETARLERTLGNTPLMIAPISGAKTMTYSND